MFYLLAVTFPVVTSASNSSHNPDSGIDHVESLQTVIMKRHPELLPSFLKSKRGWDNGMLWAFSIGLALGRAKNLVVRRRFYKDRIFLMVSPMNLGLFLSELSSYVWEEKKEGLSTKTIAESVLPLLFKMDRLFNDLEKSQEPMTLMEFKSVC